MTGNPPLEHDLSAPAKKAARQPPRSRFKPQATAGLRLEPRDEQLLCDLFLQRAMSRGQIQTLYFSSLVRCNARLRQLFDHRYVARYYSPAAPFGAQAVYTIGKAALPLVARLLEMELPEVSRFYRRSKTPTFTEHTLAVVDIWIAFRDAVARTEGVEIERWVPEMLCRHEYEIRAGNGGRWGKEAFKPDAFVRLTRHSADDHLNFFIEVDLGHTSSRQFLGKLLTHRRYLESGLFQQTFGGDSFRTLVITTGGRRIRNLSALAEEKKSDLFWFATFGAVQRLGVLNPIWNMPSQAQPVTLT